MSLLFVEKKSRSHLCLQSSLKKKTHTHKYVHVLSFTFFFELPTHLTTLPLLHPTEVKPHLKKENKGTLLTLLDSLIKFLFISQCRQKWKLFMLRI